MQRRHRQLRDRGRGRLRTATLLSLVGIGLVAGTVYAGASPEMARAALAAAKADRTAPWTVEKAAEAIDLASLSERVSEVNGAWAAAADYYDREVAPIERVLRRYGADQDMSRRIAVSLVREANAVELEPRLLLAVLLVENPWLDPEIRSSVGAIGLMQIMPIHRGGWSMCGPDLEDVEDNICHGANIFAHYFRASGGDVDVALLRYNGCVNGTNTPNCHQYPNHVFARAGRASVLAWLDQGPVAASP
jgi:soluble lytic murein transglycosylase-like protein